MWQPLLSSKALLVKSLHGRLSQVSVVVMVLHHEVVDEGAEDAANVGHDPRDPEEVVGLGEGLAAESGHQGQKATKK